MEKLLLGWMTECIMYLKVAVPSYFGEGQPSFIPPTRDVHALLTGRNHNESWVLPFLKLPPKGFVPISVQAASSPMGVCNNSPVLIPATSPLLQAHSFSEPVLLSSRGSPAH